VGIAHPSRFLDQRGEIPVSDITISRVVKEIGQLGRIVCQIVELAPILSGYVIV